MSDDPSPWFSAAEEPGLRDFWTVYDAHWDEVTAYLMRGAAGHPELRPIFEGMDPEFLAAQNSRRRARIDRGVAGDWNEYEASLHAQGAFYARLGISISGWHALTDPIGDMLIPLLFDAYGENPARLQAALHAMHRLHSLSMAFLGQEYLRTKEAQIRESEQSTRRAEEARRQVEVANRELEAFSYSVAHDLRAPLRGMNGFAQLLVDSYSDKLDVTAQDWLQEILQNARKMADLIDALLSLSRVSRSELNRQMVDLASLVRASVARLALAEPHRTVAVLIEDGLRAEIDPNLARVMLDNLVANAWKFTGKRESPRIEFGVLGRDESRTFFLRDNGAGFDMAYAGKLFAPFQRLHTVREFPGTGIGLATVQRIVHRHGGSIWAEGAVEKGATFYFTLPGRGVGERV